ncbi:MAG: restriction endonuclease [Proteobacteria bacterium]|uniref:Restriction endonuclease n=1 Tax=Candidatus Avisuccinivibrio stercorigallinarum TaxID=2840704 RepID=A0A9D9DE70_9GAMM|nr:restriction endonuclease [Candidatus Avisuccinivibrio stercorigallinarum]
MTQGKQSIYDIKPWPLDIQELELKLKKGLIGLSLAGLALRTRSKVVKERICLTLGYPIPNAFARTKPRFPCENLDVFIQKSNNIQIWNQDIDINRRYAIIRVDATDTITDVKLITGKVLSKLANTETLTQKYQAILPSYLNSQLYSKFDTNNLSHWLQVNTSLPLIGLPTDLPQIGHVLPIDEIYNRLSSLIGLSCPEISRDQERNRGAILHKEVCRALGFDTYLDNGSFPDIPNQLLEVKLQTSQTIDLGKFCPNDYNEVLPGIFSNDIRYAIFFASCENGSITLRKLFVVTGEQFFELNKKVEGINKKIQVPIPHDFFN